MGDYLKPKTPGREFILGTISDNKRFVNPVILPDLKEGWPKPISEHGKERERSLATQVGSMSNKERF